YLDRIDRDLQENVRLRQEQRARELEQKKREEELARKREEKRFEELQMTKEQARLDRFKTEVASRRKEREEWLRALEESETERQRKLEEQAQFIYQEAIKYYKKREFEQAKEDFLEVQKIVPGYKSTGKYLSRIDKDIEKEQKQRHEDQEMAFRRRMREKKMLEQQKWEENEKLRAAEDQDRLREFKEKTLARKKQREEWERVIEENEHERQRKLGEEAEFIYQEALRAYSATRWEEARADFTEVARILPGYKLTEKYLSGLDDDIQKEEQERRRTIQETSKERNQKEASARKQEEKHQQNLRKIADKKEFQRKEVQAEAVYQFAVSLYKREKYEQAKDKFLEADQILSGYRATEKYLKNIDRDIKKAERSREKEQQIVFEQQLREQRLAQKREESRLEQMRTSEEERRLLKLREEASLRERERKQWEETIQDIEKEHLKRLSRQTESVYDEALRYYKAGWFEQARETLEEVDAMWPGYKSTEKYFARIDSEIRKNRRLRRESEEDIVERQKWQEELAQQKKDDRQWHVRKAEDQERLEELKKETLARRREKEKLKESMEDVEWEHQRRLKKKAKTIYLKAVKHYKAREFEKAKTAFIEVERTLPDYKSTEKYLARLDKDIMDEKIDMEKRVVKSLEGYAEEPDPYALEKNGHKFVKKVSQEREKEFSREAETKYREALAFYKAREFIRAKLKFIDVESLSPGYKATLDYLGRIDKDIGEKQRLWMEQQTGRAEKEEPLFEDQEAPVLGQKREVVEQALLDVERHFQEAV
ncbi:MAG: hypothetical protein KAR31_03095, partial [Candidatus Omnitrophica bacterium]|nr:hypothetical protein [Candidatus Omnitrophota bacterium]